MAIGETADLAVRLSLQDELSLGIAKANDALGNFGDRARTVAANARSSFSQAFSGISGDIQRGIGLGLGISTVQITAQAISAVKDFAIASVQAAAADQLSQAQLTAALKANVAAWDGNSDAIERHITANTAAAFTDDDLRTSLEKLVAATHDVSQAFDIQSIAIDLARFKGEDLAAATDALVKVQAGNFRSLKSLGIATTDITTSTQAFAAIQKLVAGQSDAFLASDAGKAEKLKVATDELSESFGRFASGPLADAQEGLANFFNLLSGATVDRINQQGKDIADNAASFVKNATLAQLQAARDATEKGIKDLAAQVSATSALPIIGILISPSQKAALDALELTLANLDSGISTFGQDFTDHADRIAHATADWTAQTDLATRAQLALTVAIGTADGATKEEQAAAAAAAAEFKVLGSVFDGFNATITNAVPHMGIYSADLDNIALKAVALKAPIDDAASATQALTDALLLLPTTVNIDVVTRFQNAQQGAGIEQFVGGGGAAGNRDTPPPATGTLNQITTGTHSAVAAFDNLSSAFQNAKQTGVDFFDTIHQKILRQIQDVLDLASKEHNAAIARINDTLAAQLATNAGPVNAAEKALRDRENAQQLRDLRSAVTAAGLAVQGNTDPNRTQDLLRAQRAAQEALANFQSSQNIDALREQQAADDAKAQAQATADKKGVDAVYTAAQAKAKVETDAEAKADKARRRAFDTELSDLQAHLNKVHAKHSTAITQIEKLYTDFIAKVEKLKLPGVGTNPITFTVNLPAITLNGRAISAAMSATAQPTQSTGVRQGQSRPTTVVR